MTLQMPVSPDTSLPGEAGAGWPVAGLPADAAGSVLCAECVVPRMQPSFWRRYRSFFLSFNTLVTILCGLLLLAGALANWVLAAPALANFLWIASALVGGAPIFVLAARGIARGDLTAGVMVSVAMLGALLIAEYSATALVAFMMMFGEILENFTMARADNALRELARLLPFEATILLDGREIVVPVPQVKPGDLVLVRNGGRIPVDGTVVVGHAAIDQATITGESIPVDKGPGDGVFAGTLNSAGTLQMRAEKVGSATVLGTVVKLVAEAQKTQAPVQRLANRYARYLVPFTFGLALLTYLITGEAVRAVTVLVVVCPCALVLATPTALVAAIANAARHQVLVKSGAALEALGRVGVVAFDKTGTLTLGRPQVSQVVALNGASPDDILRFAAAAERYSEHPLGRAIYQAALGHNLPVPEMTEVTVLTGSGVAAQGAGRQVVVGRPDLLRSAGVAVTGVDEARLAALQRAGYTVVPVALDAQLTGLIALSDTMRPAARSIVAALRAEGVATVLISGDNAAAVQALAGSVGVDAYHAAVLPDAKLALIRGLQSERPDPRAAEPAAQPGLLRRFHLRFLSPAAHRWVAYVGDGVNDAPALAAANVGIAMGGAGSDVAVETAQVALMTDDIARLPLLLGLARETLRTMRICVAFSMSMNLLALTLSMLGVIGPPAGALMHELSAIPVLAYAARLVAYEGQS